MTSQQMRHARMNAGKSIRALGKHLDVPEQTIRRLESGLSISLENAKKLADFYGCQVTDFEQFATDVEQAA